MRIFQEEIFGPVVSVTSFADFDDAIKIANDTLYGLGAGVWTRDVNTAYRAGRAIQAGRVWTNSYHAYPAHAAFGGYKGSGIGRETHKMMLDHYQQTKNLLVSYSPEGAGLLLGRTRRRDDAPRVDVTPAAAGLLRSLRGRSRAADVPPVRRLLRRQRPHVLPGRRVPHRDLRCAAGRAGGARRGRAGQLLDVPGPVRAVAAHPPHRGRRARPGQRLLPGGAGGGALPDPLPAAHPGGERRRSTDAPAR